MTHNIVYELLQVDGRVNIKELHISDSGKTYSYDYMCQPSEVDLLFATHTDSVNQQEDIINSQQTEG